MSIFWSFYCAFYAAQLVCPHIHQGDPYWISQNWLDARLPFLDSIVCLTTERVLSDL